MSGPNCEICPRKDLDDGFCEECTKNWWHVHNIKRCQYAYEQEHGPRYPEMEKKTRTENRSGSCSAVLGAGGSRPSPTVKTGKSKRKVPAEFIRQRQREEEIRRKSEEWENTPEIEAARAAALAKMEAIFGKRG